MTFNTEEFLQTTTEEVLDDHLDPCPAGEWLAIASAPEVADFEYKKGDRKGETGYRMIIKWDIQDEGAKSLVDRDKVTVTQSILLDLTEDGSGLDMGKGKNIGLGQIRTALGQNEAGAEWSPSMISGQPAKIQVKADVYQGRTTAQVVAVTTP
jgi:hypothetical protein